LQGETREHWRKLCEQAAEEKDPTKLMELIEEINRLLESKEERLLREREEANRQSAA